MEPAINQSNQLAVIASRAGKYDEDPTVPPLRAYFQCVGTNTISAFHSGPVVVVPDGCVDMLWRGDRFVVVGPDIVAAYPDLKPGTTVLGIRFRPGAASSWLNLPVTEIVGGEVPMTDIWGRRANDMEQKIGSASTVRGRLQLMQQLLVDELSKTCPCPADAAVIFHALNLQTQPQFSKIDALHKLLDISERTLRRQTREFYGYGPKTLDRILRFQRFQTFALSEPGQGLANMAFHAGYADQAHLGREVQSLCQMTPGELLTQLASKLTVSF
jgi:AraC-like DNA-binding protein